MSLFVSRAPATSLAPYALQDLDRVCRLFRRVAKLLPFSAKSLVRLVLLFFLAFTEYNFTQPIMEKLAEKARRACSQWHSTAPPPPSAAASGTQLPPAFHHAHPILARYAGEMTFVPPRVPMPGSPPLKDTTDADAETWLPDVYRFASHGVGIDERYRIGGSSHGDEGFASAQPTPFMPGEPRIAANDNFNFEHGALTAELAETSYMAWF